MSETENGERESALRCETPDAETAMDTREMPCPACGATMPDLKGGKDSICPNCGFKDSCCY